MTIDGQILFAPIWGTTTYLIDNTGMVNHTWSSGFYPGIAVLWLGEETILRTIRVGSGPSAGGEGGGVQKILWNGTVVWDFRYNTDGVLSHHDVKTLPNGNVLLIAWETKTRSEAIAAGRNPNNVASSGFMVDHIVEVQPVGQSSGVIVWEWHVWDHLIQDYDSSKANYGIVGNHPELVDVNFAPSIKSDWMHTNSIDYNEKFDQIMISVHNFNEVWVIDHSTTTEEAAGHTGGNSRKGGDLLYRWGNPEAYRAGTSSNRKFFGQHDASWIKPGYSGEGNILVFNNGVGRGYSSVDEIIPPVDENGEYFLEQDTAYGPEEQSWIYTSSPPTSFYAAYLSGAQRLTNGDTLICNGETGKIFEVTPEGETVWQYTNSYPNPSMNDLFKVVYIPLEELPEPDIPNLDCMGSLSWKNVKPNETVTGSFQVKNIGGSVSLLNWTIIASSIEWGTWTFTPSSGSDLAQGDNVTITAEVVAPTQKKKTFTGKIKIINSNNTSDFCEIDVSLKTPRARTGFNLLHWILEKYLNTSPIIRYMPA